MGEEKEKIQPTDNGQGNEVEKQTAESQEKEKNKKNKKALISTIISWALIGIYLGVAIPLHNKFDNFSTHWLLFGLFALIIPCGTFNFMLQGLALNDISKEKQANAARRLIIFTFYLWFVDLFYMVSFNNWLVWIYILGIILLLIAISNLIKVFLGKTEVFKKFILGDLLIALVLTAFLIYKIPENYGSLQSIVTTIVAAVYGGMLTLTGVAWTIKRQDEIRKEEEKREIKPYVVLVNETFNRLNVKKMCFANIGGYGKIGEDKTYILDERFLIKNVGRAACVLAYIKINGKKQNCVMQSLVVNENALVCSIHKKNLIKIAEDRLLEIKLGIYDVNYNLYEYNVVFRTSLHPFKYESINENEKIYFIKSDKDTFYSKGIAVDYIDCSSDSIKENIREFKDRPLEEIVEDMKKITGDKNDNN